MSISSDAQVRYFLLLQQKTIEELRAISKPFGLSTEGNKEEIIERLVCLEGVQHQQDTTKPQAIPLRTRDNKGQPLLNATETMKKWRKAIFDGKDNTRRFQLINSKGKNYFLDLKFATCSQKILQVILNKKWYLAHPSQRDLINLLNSTPEMFVVNIVKKPDSKGNSWLMMHVETKREAA